VTVTVQRNGTYHLRNSRLVHIPIFLAVPAIPPSPPGRGGYRCGVEGFLFGLLLLLSLLLLLLLLL
jgi:hypothetical protein